jgi:hypothetical protein
MPGGGDLPLLRQRCHHRAADRCAVGDQGTGGDGAQGVSQRGWFASGRQVHLGEAQPPAILLGIDRERVGAGILAEDGYRRAGGQAGRERLCRQIGRFHPRVIAGHLRAGKRDKAQQKRDAQQGEEADGQPIAGECPGYPTERAGKTPAVHAQQQAGAINEQPGGAGKQRGQGEQRQAEIVGREGAQNGNHQEITSQEGEQQPGQFAAASGPPAKPEQATQGHKHPNEAKAQARILPEGGKRRQQIGRAEGGRERLDANRADAAVESQPEQGRPAKRQRAASGKAPGERSGAPAAPEEQPPEQQSQQPALIAGERRQSHNQREPEPPSPTQAGVLHPARTG